MTSTSCSQIIQYREIGLKSILKVKCYIKCHHTHTYSKDITAGKPRILDLSSSLISYVSLGLLQACILLYKMKTWRHI